MKQYKAILFDMDGTLLPMDMDAFVHGYFKFLVKKLMPYGLEADQIVSAVWAGTQAMVRNDGTEKNDRIFWKRFEELTGVSESVVGPACEDFYGNEFLQAKQFTGENLLAREAVAAAREKAPIVALATNPLFPLVGQVTRMRWVGLEPEDFDLVTHYASDFYCKPNPKYFLHVCQRLGVQPEECLLIGNDEVEDMYAASRLGIDCYLVTDTMISSEEHPWNGPRGTFAEMVEMLKAL